MLQKVMCGYTTPISKFKSNPGAVLAEAGGEAIAVSSHNQIQFYAVPAHLYEEMVKFMEFKQRGTTELKSAPAKFRLTKRMAKGMTNKLKTLSDSEMRDFVECKSNI
jgi:antitoxin StbD